MYYRFKSNMINLIFDLLLYFYYIPRCKFSLFLLSNNLVGLYLHLVKYKVYILTKL